MIPATNNSSMAVSIKAFFRWVTVGGRKSPAAHNTIDTRVAAAAATTPLCRNHSIDTITIKYGSNANKENIKFINTNLTKCVSHDLAGNFTECTTVLTVGTMPIRRTWKLTGLMEQIDRPKNNKDSTARSASFGCCIKYKVEFMGMVRKSRRPSGALLMKLVIKKVIVTSQYN
jgi:hypothetical protein